MTFKNEGLFCWADMGSTDVEASKKFYSELFGWTWKSMESPKGEDYNFAMVGDAVVAGLTKSMCSEGKSYWATYFNTSDIDSKIKKVEELGATMSSPIFSSETLAPAPVPETSP